MQRYSLALEIDHFTSLPFNILTFVTLPCSPSWQARHPVWQPGRRGGPGGRPGRGRSARQRDGGLCRHGGSPATFSHLVEGRHSHWHFIWEVTLNSWQTPSRVNSKCIFDETKVNWPEGWKGDSMKRGGGNKFVKFRKF